VKLADLYARPGLTLSVEFFPPKTEKGEENLFSEVANIKRLNPGFCSVTYGAGGSTREKTVDLVAAIRKVSDLEVMCHLTVVGQSKDEARSVLRKLKDRGIENLLALGGDPPQGMPEWRPHPDGFHHAIELVREAVALGGFSVAVAGFPEVHPRAVAVIPTSGF
jgi:methylenetetrahydrofolate reductase (NADPH)